MLTRYHGKPCKKWPRDKIHKSYEEDVGSNCTFYHYMRQELSKTQGRIRDVTIYHNQKTRQYINSVRIYQQKMNQLKS